MGDLGIKVGDDGVNVRVTSTGDVWVHTERGPELSWLSRGVTVEDAMKLVHHLTERMPVFSNDTFDSVQQDVRTYEAKKEGEAVFQKVSKLGVEYLGRDAAHLTEGELKLLHRLLDAEGKR